MKVCAMIDRSAGNESVGEMWTECAEFSDTATLNTVFLWAKAACGVGYIDYQHNITLAKLHKGVEE